MDKNKWVHIIGICGVTTAPLANMFKNLGWYVSGSDKGFFPPMSDYLKKRNIDIEVGFKTLHLTNDYYKKKNKRELSIDRFPDLVVVGNYIGINNPEFIFSKKCKLEIKSFPEVLKKYIVKSNSIVSAGTAGKTTTSALLTLIFEKAGKKPSYMIGGIANNFKDGIKNTKSDWSIIEGDEYTSARFDLKSKFFHYKPEFLLLTSCAWDHSDIFRTEQQYIDNFKKLVRIIPKDGLIVANNKGENVNEVISLANCKTVTYELNKIDKNLVSASWFNLAHKEVKKNSIIVFNQHTKDEFEVETMLIGQHNKENIIGCCALARELGIEIPIIQDAVKDFNGIKRRLEIRFKEENFIVIDDFACSPPKVVGSLKALRETFPDWHISVIFEPNVGNRTEEALRLFTKNIFKRADEVVIPRLKPVKTKTGEYRISGEELYDHVKKQDIDTKYYKNDGELVKYLINKDVGKHLVCFMGSYGWRGMIEEVIEGKK